MRISIKRATLDEFIGRFLLNLNKTRTLRMAGIGAKNKVAFHLLKSLQNVQVVGLLLSYNIKVLTYTQ